MLSVAPEVNIMSPSPSFASRVFFAEAMIFSERMPIPCRELAFPKLFCIADKIASAACSQGFVVAALSRYIICFSPVHNNAFYILV